MIVYWFLFVFFAVGALEHANWHPQQRQRTGLGFLAGFLFVTIAISFRYKVGADWDNYIRIFEQTDNLSLMSLLRNGDPFYQFINWLAHQLGVGIWLVNSICGVIFTWGLWRFCKVQPSPWLAATLAIPYLVIVVAMGYSRQAVALGILMAGLARVCRGGSVARFVPYVAIAGGFHATAVIMFPIVALASKRNRLVNVAFVVFCSYFLYETFLSNAIGKYVYYVQAGYSSQGALIRIVMNAIAAVLFCIGAQRLQFDSLERAIWRNFTLVALGILVAYFLFPSSTALDRISLYLIPLQIAVLGRLAFIGSSPTLGTLSVGLYLAVVQCVWLNFAQHARFWVPYHFYPL